LGWASGFDATIPDNADMAKLGGSKTEAYLKASARKAQANRRIDIGAEMPETVPKFCIGAA
jgi:hypothetical protein